MSKIALVVEFDVKPEHRAAFERVIRAHARRTRDTEEGCLQFDVLVPREAPDKVLLYECYRDDEAFDAHAKSALLAETRSKYQDMINARRITVCDLS